MENMKTVIENASCVELIDAVINTAYKYVKRYKSDIAHDVEQIVKHDDDINNGGYYWCIRRCGTWLFNANDHNLNDVVDLLNANYTEYKLYKIFRVVNIATGHIEYTLSLIKTVKEQ